MALVGVAAGSRVTSDVVGTLLNNPTPILLCVVATFVASFAIGQLLRLHRGVNGPTAAFASFAGGATSAVLLARDSGADERVVMTVQYLRVFMILATVPVLVATLFHPAPVQSAVVSADAVSGSANSLYTILAICGSLLLLKWLTFSGSWLIIPMLVSAALTGPGILEGATTPPFAVNLAYTVIGCGVGLLVTRDSLGMLARMLPTALAQIVLIISACAGLGLVLASQTDASALDGYLAASPGGLPAVAAVALSSGANVAFVLGVQVIRMLVANVSAPLITAYYGRKTAAGN